LRSSSERIAAELAELQSALESSLSRIISLEHSHGAGVEQGGAGITSQLGEVLITIQALEQALSEIHDPNGRRSRS
jgi:chaperonin cofactor prefoldin